MKVGKTLGLVTLIVSAELTAFALLQNSVDSQRHEIFYLLSACLLFGLVVPLAFRETLRIGNAIAISNLYWIALSLLGSVVLGYFAFDQKPSGKNYAAMALLLIAVVIQL
jgi:multidrug transporter EmrE-like cation transporter